MISGGLFACVDKAAMFLWGNERVTSQVVPVVLRQAASVQRANRTQPSSRIPRLNGAGPAAARQDLNRYLRWQTGSTLSGMAPRDV
jgi:hypothetical protein